MLPATAVGGKAASVCHLPAPRGLTSERRINVPGGELVPEHGAGLTPESDLPKLPGVRRSKYPIAFGNHRADSLDMAPLRTPALSTVVKMAGRSPDSTFVRRVVATILVLLGVALMVLFLVSPGQRAEHGPDLVAAGAVDLILATLLLFSSRLASGTATQAAAGIALGAGAAAAVLAAGGAHGVFNLAVPIIVLAAAALLPFKHAAVVTTAVLASHVASTLLHGGLSGNAGYELVESFGIAVAALAGVHALKYSLLRQADSLEVRNDELQERVRELDALHDLALGAGSAISRDELAGRGLEVALTLSGGDAGVLWLKTADGLFRVAAARGDAESAPGPEVLRKLADLGPAAGAAEGRCTLFTSDPREIPLALYGADEGSREGSSDDLNAASVMLTPLVAVDALVGIMAILDRGGRRPDARGLVAMETLAVELALGLDRKRKTMMVEQQRQQLETLNEIAGRVTSSLEVHTVLDYAVSQTAKLMNAEVAFVATMSPGTEDLQIVSHEGFKTTSMVNLVIEKGRGIGGRVAKDQRVHQSVDYTTDGRLEDDYKRAVGDEGIVTLIGAPLVNRRRVVGVLYAARRHRQVFTAEEAHVLAMLALQVAVAVENARLFEDVREKSVRDPLTGAYNRRFFDQRLLEETSRSRRGGRPTSLLIIDVDDFKHYNDAHGHTKGDILLKELVALCASSVRSSDVVGRYGGEEFVVLFPDTDLSAALVVAARIHESVRRTLGERLGQGGRVSVSGGVAELDPLDPDPGALLERADRALYEAKAAGKDRIHVDGTAHARPRPGASATVDSVRVDRGSTTRE